MFTEHVPNDGHRKEDILAKTTINTPEVEQIKLFLFNI